MAPSGGSLVLEFSRCWAGNWWRWRTPLIAHNTIRVRFPSSRYMGTVDNDAIHGCAVHLYCSRIFRANNPPDGVRVSPESVCETETT